MADETQKTLGHISTEGFPIAYANLASLTANYNDLRIYFADAQAKTVSVASQAGPVPTEANIAPRICVVMSPEFAKSLLDALTGTIAAYEKQFGSIRPTPQIPTVATATAVPATIGKPAPEEEYAGPKRKH